MIDITVRLNKAAYLILNNSQLLGFEGEHWYDCRVKVRTTQELLENSSKALVNYQAYMKIRNKLKNKMKKFYNIF